MEVEGLLITFCLSFTLYPTGQKKKGGNSSKSYIHPVIVSFDYTYSFIPFKGTNKYKESCDNKRKTQTSFETKLIFSTGKPR